MSNEPLNFRYEYDSASINSDETSEAQDKAHAMISTSYKQMILITTKSIYFIRKILIQFAYH